MHSNVREEFKEHSTRNKSLLKKGNKFSTKKSIGKTEGAVGKKKNPVTIEDLLKDCVILVASPSI